MAVAAQKQVMMDDNLTFFADRVRSAILSVDPTALVAMGFLAEAPEPRTRGDSRVVRTGPVIDNSTLDFFDLHLDPGVELTFPQYMQNYELTTPAVKPVVLGEFGAFQFAYPTAQDAERILRGVEADSCPYGCRRLEFTGAGTRPSSAPASFLSGRAPRAAVSSTRPSARSRGRILAPSFPQPTWRSADR